MRYDFDPTRLALTPVEAAAALGISKSHVYRLIHRGVLPATRLGRRLAVPAVGLMRLLDVPHPARGLGGEPAVEPPASPSFDAGGSRPHVSLPVPSLSPLEGT